MLPLDGDIIGGELRGLPTDAIVVKARMGWVDPRPCTSASMGRVGAGAKRFWRRFDLFFFKK